MECAAVRRRPRILVQRNVTPRNNERLDLERWTTTQISSGARGSGHLHE
jgi:hypothetical protein